MKPQRPKSSKSGSKASETSSKTSRTQRSPQRSPSESSSRRRSPRSSPSPQPVLGLDLSLTGTGLVAWDGQQVTRHRRYKTEPVAPSDGLRPRPQGQLAPDRFRGSEEERIEWLRRKVRANVRKFQPKLVVIEGHAFAAKGRGKTVLSELAGVIKNQLHRMEIPFVIVAPTSLKKYATGDGKASKVEMVYAAVRLCRDIADSDQADALHAARFGFENYDNLTEE